MNRVAIALISALAASPAVAAPWCHAPRDGGLVIEFGVEVGNLGESDRAKFYEMRLNAMGIPARNTTFWNGCVQAEVRENGRNSLRMYDPWSLEEIPIE
jgi:hypothetical protein